MKNNSNSHTYIDGSEAMLEKLRAKCIYSRTFCCVLGDKFKKIHQDIFDESYDIVIIMGGFAQSHLPINSLYQAARALKPGSIFHNILRINLIISLSYDLQML